MQYFRYRHVGKQVTLYPLVCWHIGANQSDEQFIKEHVQRIADDPDGRWIYLGDGGECVTKQSKGEVYHQRLSPTEQIHRFVELVEPIQGKGLFGISGNHDRRIVKESGLDWTDSLCTKLGIPYLGLSAFLDLHVASSEGHKYRLSYHVFCHHGVDSSVLLGGKVNAASKLERLVDADAFLSAHSHVCMELQPSYISRISSQNTIEYRETHSFICGCAYDSRIRGYAEEKGYPPILPAHIGVTFFGGTNHHKRPNDCKRITSQIYRKEI